MEGSSEKADQPARRRRGCMVRILLAILFLVICGAGVRVALPGVIERAVAFVSREYVGLPARIDNVDLGVVEGMVLLEGVTVGPKQDGVKPLDAAWNPPEIPRDTALLHFDRILIRFSWGALLEKTVRLTEVSLDSPVVRLVREADGMIDPLRHAKPAAPPAEEKKLEAEADSEPWRVEVAQFALNTPGVAIVDEKSSDKLLEFSLESFRLDDVGLRGMDVGFGAMGIEGPVLKVQRDFVLAESATATSAPAGSAPAGNATTVAGFRIRKIDVERAQFTWLSKEGPLDVQMTLRASGVTAAQGVKFPMDLAVQVLGGNVRLAGDVGVLPPSFHGNITWSDLPFPPLLLAAQPKFAAWLPSAKSGGDVSLDVDLGVGSGPPKLRIAGRSVLRDFQLTEPRGEVSVGWDELEVVARGIEVPIPDGSKPVGTVRADFDLIRFSSPSLRYTHPPGFLKSDEASAVPPGDSGPPVEVETKVERFEISGGTVEVKDTTTTPAASSSVKNLEVQLRDIRFPDPSVGSVSVRATLPSSSSLAVDGALGAGMAGDFTISLKSLDLPTFSPYAMAAGASLDAGEVSLDTKLSLRGAAVQAESDLVLSKFGISLRDPSSFSRQFGMPIDLAIALLSDPQGDIRLKIPVRMDEKGATVPVGTVVASALKAALVGALTTPLKLLGASLGGPGTSAGLAIPPVKSVAGSAELDVGAAGRADSLVKLLAGRPGMGLVLRGRTGPADNPIVAAQILMERTKAGDPLPEVKDAGLLARLSARQILLKRARGEAPRVSAKDEALMDRLVAAVVIPPERMASLAKSRAEKLANMLASRGVDRKKLTIGENEAAGDPGVVISLRPVQAGAKVPAKPTP